MLSSVYTCGNDVGLRMEFAGWIVARAADIGAKRVDRIMAMALTAQATKVKTGYFNDHGAPISWCGIPDVRVITVFGLDALE